MPRQSRLGKTLRTMQNVENIIPSSQEQTSKSAHYTDMSRGAASFGIRVQVQLESRVLEDYQEMYPAAGEGAADAVLSLLCYQILLGDTSGDGRMTVCLSQRNSGQAVEVDLAVCRRRCDGRETYFLRFIDERELGLDNN